jgi:hypothetical protein
MIIVDGVVFCRTEQRGKGDFWFFIQHVYSGKLTSILFSMDPVHGGNYGAGARRNQSTLPLFLPPPCDNTSSAQ